MNDWNVGTGSGGGGHHGSLFYDVICLENLFAAWKEFKKGKISKAEVQEFEFNLENNIFQLHENLIHGSWRPDPYKAFYVRDPKLRHIHKANVRDRVFNQALFRKLYPIFDPTFIHDSYSCRLRKGTHQGVLRLENFIRSASTNYLHNTFALKCDIKKFFDNISHEILFKLICEKIKDEKILEIIKLILNSFETRLDVGLPLGNVTSQLFANIYLNKLDQFVKHTLKAKYYLRYCDDFVILSRDKKLLEIYITSIDEFLHQTLKLSLHPNKISIRKISQGIDFLGYVILPHYKILRTRTKRRIYKKIANLKYKFDLHPINTNSFERSKDSYLGILSHCHGYKIKKNIENILKIKAENDY